MAESEIEKLAIAEANLSLLLEDLEFLEAIAAHRRRC
jgi:hypothetical protein